MSTLQPHKGPSETTAARITVMATMSFNPTRVRLKLALLIKDGENEIGFNPTRVRLKPRDVREVLAVIKASTPQGSV